MNTDAKRPCFFRVFRLPAVPSLETSGASLDRVRTAEGSARTGAGTPVPQTGIREAETDAGGAKPRVV
jgi:hypothetical protein